MANAPLASGRLVFTFPGQGSYNGEVLRELHDGFSYRAEFSRANDIARQILGGEFLSLVESRTAEERDSVLRACPELDQVAIYVTNYLIASELMASGLRPDFLLGHSFGELAALAVAGVYGFETGLRIVCQRSGVLRGFATGGKMAAVSCNADRAREIIRSLGKPSLEIAVINHPRQTVISGLAVDLDELGEFMARQGINLTLLKSRYPFHSALLKPGVEPFRLMLCSYKFQPAAIPVYLCTEGKLYSRGADLAAVLSEQFVKPMNFAVTLAGLHQQGFRRFVECGAGNIVTKVVLASGLEGIAARAAAHADDGPKKGCAAVLQEFGAGASTPAAQASGELVELAREMCDVLQRASRVLDGTAVGTLPNAAPAPVARAATVPATVEEFTGEVESCEDEPVAIVAMGCVLPGAHNPEQFWNNVLTGVSGIADLGLEDETFKRDFLAGVGGSDPKIVSDKTYTLLSGSAGKISYDAALLAGSYTEAEFHNLTRVEKLLALAGAQALAGLKPAIAALPADRVECILGATADGSGGYDYAVFEASMEETLEQVEPDSGLRGAFASTMRRVWGEPRENRARAAQSESCRTVIQALAGRPIRTYIIDAACSSSLYSIGAGVRALQDRVKDVMLVGGVFAPALANSALFAQFRGLSSTGTRPLDATADGVIFGEGATVLVLKRLGDAMAAGDRIFGVVRGVGISSDGKSPAINVPQSKGQSIAIRRAYEASHIDMNSIQYVEAHATATPVGDAVEFGALRQAISRDPSLPPIELGSVKALTGHTGWSAGAASVIKLCKAFERATVPPQYNYTSPNPDITLAGSPFRISTTASAWPPNIKSLPRRAAINGFGFGGTNAHLILEEYHPAYHRKLCASVRPKPAQPTTLAVIDAAILFPAESGLESTGPTTRRAFNRSALRLPKGKMVLPDVTDHMDPGQFLPLLAAERILPVLGDRLKELRGVTGVVIGVESKTERGIRANQRIFLDRLKRRFAEDPEPDGLPPGARNAILERLCAAVRKDVIPSGPYTLPGLMPNVISGRVAHMFELNGPNVVVDMGSNSLAQSVLVASDFLAHGDSKAVLAGGLNAVRMSKDDAEAVFLMLLTTEATARELNLPVACLLTVDRSRLLAFSPARRPVSYRGAEGAIELEEAIAKARDEKKESSAGPFILKPSGPAEPAPASKPAAVLAQPAPKPETVLGSAAYAFIQGTPIYNYTPVETAAELPASAKPRRMGKILFLTDQPDHWKQIEKQGTLAALNYHVLCPQPASLANATSIDLANEEAVTKTLASLPGPFDTVVPVQFLGESLPDSLLTTSADNALALVDLVFAVCRRHYDGFQSGQMAMGALSLGAFIDGHVNPFTGLIAGFVKSLARELPSAVCRSLNVADTDFRQGLALLESELSQTAQPVEVNYRDGKRFVIQLAKLEQASSGQSPLLSADSVVLATGGGRGVTAVLAEELLTRFGCTVIAVGRTNPASAPPELLQMDAAQLSGYEQEFYRRELAKGGGKKITQLRDEFRSYQAAQEVHDVVRRLTALPGKFEYISADITNGNTTTSIVDSIYRKYGRLDMVLHGAGQQISKVLTKKSINDFRSVVRAKIASLQHIYLASEQRRAGRPVHYHLLTSAFSYMGNDGQPDYGAANEAMNRLGDVMAAVNGSGRDAGQWCSIAWLGWAGIGMTRGTEFAALAANRGLRGVTKSEGQDIFSKFLVGEPTAPINVLMADGELKFYNVATTGNSYTRPARRVAPPRAKRDRLVLERTVNLDEAPYIRNHIVDGIPTLPGAYLIMIVAEAALEFRPGLKITAFEEASFRRFVRVRTDVPTKLRLNATLVSEDEQSTFVRVQVISDFLHKNGMVLQKDVVYFEMSVRLSAAIHAAQNGHRVHRAEGRMLSDPYITGAPPVQLTGPFKTLQNIVAGDRVRSAEYRPEEEIQETAYRPFLANLLVMDSLWRFACIDSSGSDAVPIYIPLAGKVMNMYYDIASPSNTPTLLGKLYMTGFNPEKDQDYLTIGPVEARDTNGAILMEVESGRCRKVGEVRNGHS
jgi:acyl transferase domain-containing protein/NAD(P)-dependent dehydrogenase (short-subunit alcohol dehydrogenase family)